MRAELSCRILERGAASWFAKQGNPHSAPPEHRAVVP